jgi:hypothetical protein
LSRRILLAALAAAIAIPAAAADDFSRQRLEEAERFVEVGDYRGAMDSFRIAAFGLMNDPPQYERALVGLALAEKAAEAPDQVKETLQKIVRVETRFPGAFDSAALSPADRKAAEGLLLATLPPEALLAAGRLGRLVPSEEEKLTRLPSRERHRAYEERASAHNESKWDIANSRLYLEEGNARLAAKYAQFALLASPGSDGVRLVYARALAALSRWNDALAEFERVPPAELDAYPEAKGDYAICLYRVGRTGEARTVLSALPAEVASRPAVARVMRDLFGAPPSR